MEDDREYEVGYDDDGMDQEEDEFGDEEPEQEEQQEVNGTRRGAGFRLVSHPLMNDCVGGHHRCIGRS